jgi:general secretion pathway protein D
MLTHRFSSHNISVLRILAVFLSVWMAAGPLVAPLQAKTRKGDNLLKKGREAEVRKQWETALDFYEQATLEDPDDAAYVMAAKRVRFQAAMSRVDAGQKLRATGRLEEALAEFQKAYAIDPANGMAEQEYKRTREMIEREKNPQGRASTPEERGLTPGEKAQKEAEEKVSRIMAAPELRPLNPQLNGGLTIRNQPVRVLYETVGKLAGINVIFDPEYQAPAGGPRGSNYTIELSNTTLEEALDYIAVQTKSYWKPLSANAIFVTNDNVTKRRDYEDYVVKVFYIKNATTVQELTEIATTVRSVAEIRRSFTYNAQNAILIRGTTDQVALAEKLIQDLDKPKAEVVVDVLVMEANRSRVRDLAATITTGLPSAPGINLPIIYGRPPAPSTGDDDDDGDTEGNSNNSITLNRLKSLGTGDFSTIVPGGLLKLLMSDTQTRVIQQPQVRAVENAKASLRIGDKIPYASGSFQPGIGVGGQGLNPLVSTQFQFADVGVNVDITPKVHGRDEISMQIELEISNVSDRVEIGGVSQPIISQKKIVHNIRLKEGEVNLLGGLLRTQESRGVQGIPWLAELPVLGRFFSSEHKEVGRGELLIALIPHVVRAPEFNDVNLRGISAGTDQNVKLSYSPRLMPQTATPQAGTPAAPATPTPAAPAAEAVKPVEPEQQPRLIFNPPVANVTVNSTVEVQLVLENVTDLYTAPVKLKFDPKVLRLTSIKPGPLLSADGQQVNFTESTMNDTGDATVTLNRIPGTGGVTGSGPVLTLTFQAIGRGTSPISVSDAGVKNLQLQPIPVSSPAMNITVQ